MLDPAYLLGSVHIISSATWVLSRRISGEYHYIGCLANHASLSFGSIFICLVFYYWLWLFERKIQRSH